MSFIEHSTQATHPFITTKYSSQSTNIEHNRQNTTPTTIIQHNRQRIIHILKKHSPAIFDDSNPQKQPIVPFSIGILAFDLKATPQLYLTWTYLCHDSNSRAKPKHIRTFEDYREKPIIPRRPRRLYLSLSGFSNLMFSSKYLRRNFGIA